MSLKLTSPSFEDGASIPDKHSKDGGNISPALSWSDAPSQTRSFALIMDDPDAPSGLFVHWLVYGIPPAKSGLDEGLPAMPSLPDGIRQGRNGFGEVGYGGPKPPSGTHRYFFHLFALNSDLRIADRASRQDLEEAMAGHVLEKAELMGRYSHRAFGSRLASRL